MGLIKNFDYVIIIILNELSPPKVFFWTLTTFWWGSWLSFDIAHIEHFHIDRTENFNIDVTGQELSFGKNFLYVIIIIFNELLPPNFFWIPTTFWWASWRNFVFFDLGKFSVFLTFFDFESSATQNQLIAEKNFLYVIIIIFSDLSLIQISANSGNFLMRIMTEFWHCVHWTFSHWSHWRF